MSVQYFCDRCGQAAKTTKLEISYSISSADRWDLCDDCLKAFRLFMKGPRQERIDQEHFKGLLPWIREVMQ